MKILTQQEKVLELLKQAGNKGVNSYALTYVYSVKQAPTRIKELKELGHYITTRKLKDRSVDYILLGEAKKPTVAIVEPKKQPIFIGNTAYYDLEPEQLTL